MFDRFTDRAKKVMSFARQEAQKFNHEYIGTEHILLGLVQEGSGVAANVLKNMDIDLEKMRSPSSWTGWRIRPTAPRLRRSTWSFRRQSTSSGSPRPVRATRSTARRT